jgi:CPA2 family monovalent cation:H+ antiporter-2
MVEFRDVGLALLAVYLATWSAGKLGIPSVVLVIGAGAILGPGAPIGPIDPSATLSFLAALGASVLLFRLGLDFSPDRFLALGPRMIRGGLLDAISFPATFALCALFGLSAIESLILAGVAYVSSSGIIVQTLSETRRLAGPEAELLLGISVVQDVLTAPFLAFLTAIVATGPVGGGVALSVLPSIVLIGVAMAAWRFGRRWIARASERETGLLVMLATAALLLIGWAASAFGVSAALAAFLLGLTVPEGDVAQRVSRPMEPVAALTVGLFFFNFGGHVKLDLLAPVAGFLAAFTLFTWLAKVVPGFLAGRASGLTRRASLVVGLGLAIRGEFSLVIAAIAASLPGLDPEFRAWLPAFVGAYVLVMALAGVIPLARSDDIAARLFRAPVALKRQIPRPPE